MRDISGEHDVLPAQIIIALSVVVEGRSLAQVVHRTVGQRAHRHHATGARARHGG